MIIRYKKHGVAGAFERPEAFELTYDEDERVGLYLTAGSEMPEWREVHLELTIGDVVFETTGRIHRAYETVLGEEMSVVPFLEINIGKWKGKEDLNDKLFKTPVQQIHLQKILLRTRRI